MNDLRLLLLLILSGIFCLRVSAQAYWQQQTDYIIDVSLNDKEKTLDGFERIVYTNNSPDTLTYIWFHLWPNAYKTDRTAFSEQLLKQGNTAFYFSGKDQKGYINRLDFKVDGQGIRTEDHPQYIDVIKLILTRPLPPRQKITITTPFHVKLPFNFSRGGYDGQSFQVTQWYPKPAVYDAAGWHPMPYLDQGEFYSEFGAFDVSITVPQQYVVAATGQLQEDAEKAWLKTRTMATIPPAVIKPVPDLKSGKKPVTGRKPATAYKRPASGKRIAPKESIPPPVQDITATKTISFKQDNIHDFAFFAAKDFVEDADTCRLPSGRVISVAAYYTPAEKERWTAAVAYAKEALRFYSEQLGEYPYATATVVQGPRSFGGGMEYPTITVVSPTTSVTELDATIAHELGHNWFYGLLATNERAYPWMDEGMNSFYEKAYVQQKYGAQSGDEERLLQTKVANKTDQPINITSEAFSQRNYNLVAYYKTARWIQLLQQKLGKEKFSRLMQQYFVQWSFRHPQPADFKAIFAPALGSDSTAVFDMLYGKGLLPGQELKRFSMITPFQKKFVTGFLQAPAKNTLLLTPAIGANSYDKLMIGAAITNYNLPPAKLRFLAIPLYATGTKSLAGLGRLGYVWHSSGVIRRSEVFVNGTRFTMNKVTDSIGGKYYSRFSKMVPGFRLTLNQKDPLSTGSRWMQWKTYFISEQRVNITPDTIFGAADTGIIYKYTMPTASRYLNQLQLDYSNDRALYPFRVMLQVEQAKDFIRPALTADYFFNYAKGGGLQVRFFAGKFIYLNRFTADPYIDRYFLNMTGPKGDEDYTYSDYFTGRNKYEGLPGQQLMIRDGAFKVRTDLLSNKIGKTDNWLTALNFSSSIPARYNPLSLLPVKIPLHLFFDIGTYAEAWDRNAATDRFLYDAGLHIPLLDETVNIYIPLFYSKVYRDYFKSTLPEKRFFKTISFSINLNNKSLRKLNKEIEF